MTEQTETALAPRHHFFSELEPWKRWEPLRTLMDRFFTDLPESWPRSSIVPEPNVDITETDGEYRVRAELPGVSKDDVTVELDQGLLSIRGEKRSRRDEESERGRLLECSYDGLHQRRMKCVGHLESPRLDPLTGQCLRYDA